MDVTKIVALALAGVMILGVFVSQTLASANVQQQEKLLYHKVVANDISEGVRLVSLHLEEESLNSALKQLARKANVGFSFNPEIIPDKSISANFESITVHEALSRLLEGTGLEVKLPPTRDVIVIKEKPQKGNEVAPVLQTTVTGTVTDAQTGDPLPGANVSIQGTTTGSSTNSEGEYSISDVEPGTYTFVASFIGYQESTREVTIGQNQQQVNVDFSLQPSQLQMEEMVVTALGVQQESRALTSSVGQVEGESVAQSQDINVANSLAGRVSGVQVQSAGSGPGGSSRVVIRGFQFTGR
ncbi:MAG: carboxypeptidase-like regulatory domain-containing protein [Balneolaceae bacterium]|nr:carboxypeptidase-like regulatory domain-containing protein [Balneolaceae bacterium]